MKYYLTSPIYYVNSKPHIGHSYTNIAGDALARFERLSGKDVKFLTGTDEHGQKIDKAAQAAGLSPQEFTDKISLTFRDLWKSLNISYDDFIRTTEERHKEAVKKVWLDLNARGQIYAATYSGWYCTPCETFWTEGQIVSEKGVKSCPDCKRGIEYLEEENYFFKLSQYQEWLKAYILEHDRFIMPQTRRNEVLGFLDSQKLQDLCISRPKNRLAWGIQSPISENHVTYVWFDALINYIAGCGYGDPKKAGEFKKWWPADVHLIGKDILRHHAVYWSCMLHGLGLEPPKMIFAHGWWVIGGEKMSKSRGNAVDPIEIVKTYGIDPYRYFLLSETTFGEDGTFSEEALIDRFNHNLANDLGNLLHRSLTMCEKYFGGEIPGGVSNRCKNVLSASAGALPERMVPLMERLAFSDALSEIWTLINQANKFIEEKAPWKLSKEGHTEELQAVIVSLLESLKVIAQAVWPFMPHTGEAIWAQLGIQGSIENGAFKENNWGFFENGGRIAKGAPLFPRIEVKKE